MNKKVILILPAYNVVTSLKSFLNKIPPNIFAEIILVDDYSTDDTFRLSQEQKGIKSYRNNHNLGYGGNLKVCLAKAKESGADIVVELHPDGEYLSDGVLPALKMINEGAVLVLGNRFNDANNALYTGMFYWKYPFIRLLNGIDNSILRTKIPDLHQGFRVYSKKLLDTINLNAASNDYAFSFELICQAVFQKLSIASVSVTTCYRGRKRGANVRASIIYAVKTLFILVRFIFAKLGFKTAYFQVKKPTPVCPACTQPYFVTGRYKCGSFKLYFCSFCQNGFTCPVPKNIAQFYPPSYWRTPGLSGAIKKTVFSLFQSRRKHWLESCLSAGKILDVGSGEGEFACSLPDRFHVTSLEFSSAKISNKQVLKKNFLTWETKDKFQAITFWESLEHTPNPQKYLNKAYQLLAKGGYLFIEYPRYNCWERKLFGRHWFHLDMPRHLFHLTDNGLETMVEQSGFAKINRKPILSFDYAPWGLAASMFASSSLLYRSLMMILLVPIILMAALIELVFFTVGQSPIGFLQGQKN